MPNNREGPQAREPCKCLNRERQRKTGQRGLLITSYKRLEKRRWSAVTPVVEAVCVPAHLAPPGSLQDNQLCHLHAQPSLGQSCHRQEKACVCAHRVASAVSGSLQPCRLWPARLLCQGVLQARTLERIGQYRLPYLLEHCISCCPSRQSPWGPGAARTPATQAAAPPPHLALTGADPSPPGQPQEQTPVDDPHAEVEIKPQLKPGGSVAEEGDPKPAHQL